MKLLTTLRNVALIAAFLSAGFAAPQPVAASDCPQGEGEDYGCWWCGFDGCIGWVCEGGQAGIIC